MFSRALLFLQVCCVSKSSKLLMILSLPDFERMKELFDLPWFCLPNETWKRNVSKNVFSFIIWTHSDDQKCVSLLIKMLATLSLMSHVPLFKGWVSRPSHWSIMSHSGLWLVSHISLWPLIWSVLSHCGLSLVNCVPVTRCHDANIYWCWMASNYKLDSSSKNSGIKDKSTNFSS